MTTVSHGADAERLRGVGQELVRSSQALADVATSGRTMAQVLAEEWSGPDLEYFVGQGWPGAEKVVHDSSELVRAMGDEAVREAEQQDVASTGAGAFGSGAFPGTSYEGDHPGMDAPPGERYGELDQDIIDRWGDLDARERQAVLQQIVNDEAERSGIDPPPAVGFSQTMDANEYGVWNEPMGWLTINADVVDDPRLAINTAVHELRHAQQWDAVWADLLPLGAQPEDYGASSEQAQEWREGHFDYKKPPSEGLQEDDPAAADRAWDEYWDQPVEVDAREAGKDYVEGMTEADLDRLLEEAEENRVDSEDIPNPAPPH